MQENNITKLIGLKGVKVIDLKELDDCFEIYTILKSKPKSCTCCKSKKIEVLDHKLQRITDLPFRNKKVILVHKNTRYKCRSCRKKFSLHKDFVSKGCRITDRLKLEALNKLQQMVSIKDIANNLRISTTVVFNLLKIIRINRIKADKVINIDEFKGDSGKEKYQTIIGDSHRKLVLDVLESRKQEILNKYFNSYDEAEKKSVEVFVSDMYLPFKNIKRKHFSNAVHVIDRYHFVRQVTWAFENIRKSIRNKVSTQERIHFMRSRKLLCKPQINLSSKEKIKVSIMLERNERLREAYLVKESFYTYVMTSKNKSEAKVRIRAWIDYLKSLNQKEWRHCITSFTNWIEEISNSFEYNYTNAFIEGKNNKTKVLKRITNCMPNFHNFRNRILALN